MFLSLLHPRRFFSFSPYRWLSVLSFAAGLASAPILRADEREPWWEYAYTGDALPPESEPPWSVVEPKIKSGMVIKDSVVDGNLLMSYTGNRVVHYYNIGFSDGRFVWTTTSSKDGNTVEFRARAADAVPGVPYVALFALTGFGDEKRKAGYVMLGPNGVHAFGQAVPIDAAEFHVYRVVADPQAQSFSLHVDGDPSPVASASWDDLPDELPSERLFFGGTYASSFQGTLELDYLAWTNRAAIVPDGSTPQAPASQPKKEQASAPVPAEPRKTSVPVDLSDPDIARVDQLFRNFDRFFRVAVPRSVIKPVIDGKVETAEWKDASQFTGLVAANEPGAFWVKHDPDTVYLAFQLERSAGPPARASTTGRSEDVWSSEDGVELMFSPDKERKTVASLYLNANSGYAEGTSLEGAAMDLSWKGNWTLKSRVTGRGIEGEVAIPKSQFDAFLSEHHLPPDTASWGFNAMRVDLSPAPAQADLTDMWSSGGYDGAFMGSLDFISDRAGVQVETIGALDGDRIGFRGMLRNGESRPLRAKLRYAIYRATRDVRKNKINFFETWDKVHRIRTTDSDVDEGAAVQLFLGENTWLKNLGQAYELVAEETLDLDVPAGRQVPFEAGVNQPSGQFIAAIRLTDSDGGRVLWSQTLPFEIRSEFDLHLTKRFLTAGGVAVRFDGSGSSSLQKGDELKAALVDGKTGRVLDRWDAWFEDKTIPLEHFFAMTGLPPGSYTLDASVVNA